MSKITSMNRTLGTTVILSSPTDRDLKHFASVLIFLDHGHIWKIRPGLTRGNNRNKNNEAVRVAKTDFLESENRLCK